MGYLSQSTEPGAIGVHGVATAQAGAVRKGRPGLDSVTIRHQQAMGSIAQRKTRLRKHDGVHRNRVTVGAALFCRVSSSQTHAWSLINVSSAMLWRHLVPRACLVREKKHS